MTPSSSSCCQRLQGGRILVDGVPLTELNLRNLHRKTAIVAQDTQLFATR